MEKKLVFVQDRSQTQRGVQLEDGRIISLYDENNHFYLRFDNPLDLDKGTYSDEIVRFNDPDYDDCVTLNSLIEKCNAKEVFCCDRLEYFEDIYPDKFKYSDRKVKEICKFFKVNGYNVTEEAVRHNILAWMSDYKSGYRDEKNGYHLFTPCGCNPLSIRLNTLHKLCDDWQTTYMC
jgi:hypothetical protein